MKGTRVSQQQIARDLGVSQTLVSMVLNGRRQGISQESYEQIWGHARRVGYRPRGVDVDLLERSAPATTVGCVLRSGVKLHNHSPFFGHVLEGLHEEISGNGGSLAFLGSEDRFDAEKMKEANDKGRGLRGVVVLGEVHRSFLYALKHLEPRIVLISAQYPGLCSSVVYNEEQAAALMVEHLAGLGHRNFAWLGGGPAVQRLYHRYEATVAALHLRGLEIAPSACIKSEEAERLDGARAAAELLAAHPKRQRPTAWICFNGTMARGAANHLLQNGLKIPQDISLVTFDRTRLCTEEHPGLTGASAEPEELGRVAARLLFQSSGTADEAFSDHVLPSTLIVRESSGPRPGRGKSRGAQ